MQLQERIVQLVDDGMRSLAPHLRDWVESHRVMPRCVEACTDLRTLETTQVWLVTDHNGHKDSGYRIVYDSELEKFGLETQIQGGPSYLLGFYGGFAYTVENM